MQPARRRFSDGAALRRRCARIREVMLFRSLLALLLLAASAAAQSRAVGFSSHWAHFDPLKAPRRPVGPSYEGLVPFRTSIPLDEYMKRKSSIPFQPLPGGPTLQTRDFTGRRTPDPAPRLPLLLAPTSSFEGVQQTNLVPPDPDIAVGPEEILMSVHSAVARFTKDGSQTNFTTYQEWFSALLPVVCPYGTQYCLFYDPSIRYDPLHGRFLIVCQSNDFIGGRTFFMISVSNGPTYAGGWRNWALPGEPNGTTPTNLVLDFPQFGYDNEAVYLSGNMFDLFNILKYAKLRILKKSELYNPATQTLTYQDFWDLKNADGTTATSLRPVCVRGRAGAPGAPGIMLNASDTANADYLTLWRILNPTSAAPTLERTTLPGLWRYTYPQFAPQLNSPARIDPGDTRIQKAILRNGVVFTARGTGYAEDPTTVTYDRIDLASNTVTLQTRISNGHFFFPAFDVPASNGPGNAVPAPLIAGTTTGENGQLAYPGIRFVKAGEDIYARTSRWGDFFGGSVDPVNGGLWVSGEYAKTRADSAGRWGTWIALFPWDTAQAFADVPPSSPFFHFVNVMKLWSITAGCSASEYCPAAPVTRGQMAVFLIRAIFGEGFSYPQAPYFSDVPATHPFFADVQKLREQGITAGCSATEYCVDRPITRWEMSVFVVRGKLKSLHGDDFQFPQTAYFTDVPASDPRFKFVQKLRELGITAGCSASAYCPADPVTREQMAVFIVRAFLN